MAAKGEVKSAPPLDVRTANDETPAYKRSYRDEDRRRGTIGLTAIGPVSDEMFISGGTPISLKKMYPLQQITSDKL
jgi:hypothetical protein